MNFPQLNTDMFVPIGHELGVIQFFQILPQVTKRNLPQVKSEKERRTTAKIYVTEVH